MKDLALKIVSVSDPREVQVESRFECLRSNGFVRAETAMDQWFILVNDAWKESHLPMNEVVRDYLTVMLNRFVGRADLLEQLAEFDHIAYLLGSRKIDSVCSQDVADMSLQYVAFFSERSRYRHEPRSLEYSSEIGVSLYQQLSYDTEGKDDWFSRAYSEMGKAFGQAVMVLRSINPAFQYQHVIATETGKKGGLLFRTDNEAARAKRTEQIIDGMYLEPQPPFSGLKRNN